jgi:hypothetical protein
LNKNTKHLVPMYVLAVVLFALIAVGVVAALRRGDYLVPGIVLVATTLIAAHRIFQKRKIEQLFRHPSPEKAVAYFHATMARIPNGRATSAYSSALALAFYGDYDRSRLELAAVNWVALPPMYEGFRTHALSVLAILEEKNYQKALDLAQEARELCNVPNALPGSSRSRRALDAHVRACELLIGNGTDTVANLESASAELPVMAAVIPSWSLATHYGRSGHPQLAQRHLDRLRRIVPHGKPFFQIMGSTESPYRQ